MVVGEQNDDGDEGENAVMVVGQAVCAEAIGGAAEARPPYAIRSTADASAGRSAYACQGARRRCGWRSARA
eukprot:14406328-Heterocapsa_arctica.AAC.1